MACEVDECRRRISEISDRLTDVDCQIQALRAQRCQLIEEKDALTRQLERCESSRILHDTDWSSNSFPWHDELDRAKCELFGISRYREHQLPVINVYLSGHDVMMIMATGGGKSLCYQLPAVGMSVRSLTLVVAPLVSLIEDQLISLQHRLGADKSDWVAGLTESTTKDDIKRIYSDMTDVEGRLRLLYVTPEKLAKSKIFMNKLQKSYEANIFRYLAIDEMHCCSQWGHDFRPDYKYLGVMRQLFPSVPILGLTATTTPIVTRDVKDILGLKACLTFTAPPDRPNLIYEVIAKPESSDACTQIIADLVGGKFSGGSGIVYALTIKDVESLAEALRERGIKALPYHASLPIKFRAEVHRKWIAGPKQCQCVVATIAFGMGIDKPDVRFVIHHSMSKSIENYCQESGRAGRDGRPASCILLYRLPDAARIAGMVFSERTGLQKMHDMLSYALNDSQKCRRSLLLRHFEDKEDSGASIAATQSSFTCNRGDTVNRPQLCDVCRSGNDKSAMDRNIASRISLASIAEALVLVLDAMRRDKVRATVVKLAAALCSHGGDAKFRVSSLISMCDNDCLNVVSRHICRLDDAYYVIGLLLTAGVLIEDIAYTPYSTNTYMVINDRIDAVQACSSRLISLPSGRFGAAIVSANKSACSLSDEATLTKRVKQL